MEGLIEGVGELRAGRAVLGIVNFAIRIPDGTIHADKTLLRKAANCADMTLTIPSGFVLSIRVVHVIGDSARISVLLPAMGQ